MNSISIRGWSYNQLWNGCILASIAHSIMVAHYPYLSNEHSWDEFNYNFQNSEGVRGTVTFQNNFLVAAFRNDETVPRKFTSMDFFQGAPDKIIKIAETETLQYLLESINGEDMPLITTAIWGFENKVFSLDTFDIMIRNGGGLLERQVMEVQKAIESWEEYYEMTEEQTTLMKSIYQRKISNPKEKIVLSLNEINLIGTSDEEGLNESRTSFDEIGIDWIK
ncbi:hypothetical protein EPK97_18285 [Chengkuizengella sediminis]|nr:hypothetical protein [Chengkuizengella sediminis]